MCSGLKCGNFFDWHRCIFSPDEEVAAATTNEAKLASHLFIVAANDDFAPGGPTRHSPRSSTASSIIIYVFIYYLLFIIIIYYLLLFIIYYILLFIYLFIIIIYFIIILFIYLLKILFVYFFHQKKLLLYTKGEILSSILTLPALFVVPQGEEGSGQDEQAPLSPVRTSTGEESRTPGKVEEPFVAARVRNGLFRGGS